MARSQDCAAGEAAGEIAGRCLIGDGDSFEVEWDVGIGTGSGKSSANTVWYSPAAKKLGKASRNRLSSSSRERRWDPSVSYFSITRWSCTKH
jgi:hypothetical protein